MTTNGHSDLVAKEGQPSANIQSASTTLINEKSGPPVTPKPRRRPNRKGKPCAACRQTDCTNGSVCGNNNGSFTSDQVTFPPGATQRPSVDSRKEKRPQRPRVKVVSSSNDDPSTVQSEPQNPGISRKTPDHSASSQPLQSKRPPPRVGVPKHPRASKYKPPHERGKKIVGPPSATIKPQQRDVASDPSTIEQDPTPQQSPLRKRVYCREWLKGNCSEESNCPFIHDLEARAAEELRLQKVAEEQAAEAAQEAVATVEEMVLPSTKATFGAGATVKKVLTGHETCRVLVKNLPLTATKAEVVTLFTQPGIDPTTFTVHPPHSSPSDRSHMETVVEFEDLETGKNAVEGLGEIEFESEKLRLVITSRQGGMGKSKDRNSHILTVTWPAPSDTAFASYSSMDEANSKRTELEKQTFKGRKIKTNLAKKPLKLPDRYWNSATISVNGLEPGLSMESIQEFCGTSSIRMATNNTRSYDVNDAIPSLEVLVINAHPEDYGLVTWEHNLVPDKHGLLSAKIRFPTWDHAKTVRDVLDQKLLPCCGQVKCFVSLTDPLHYAIHVPYPQYKAQEKLFRSLLPAQKDRSATAHLRILANQPDRPARIELSGSDKKTIGRLKVRIEQLIAGEKLPQWDRVFHRAEGETFLKKVSDESQAYVRADKRQRALKAFGEPAAIEQAKVMIQEEVDRLASLQFEVFLKAASVRFFLDGARGSTLLKQEVGEENVMLDVSSTPCKIVVRGGESARHFLDKLIRESLSSTIRTQHQLKDGEICPVCYDTIDQPYRLACGHVYCYGCLRHFLLTASDTKRFPLSCINDEGKCCVPIPLPVIKRFLLPAQFKRLLEISFLEYLGHHPNTFKYCSTPDCPEIYTLESDSCNGGFFHCQSCFAAVCLSCQEDHGGFSCEEWKLHREREAQERLLEGWAEGNKDVKKCPQCNIFIEKDGGCNHMTCPKCSAHICWRCMGVFPAEEIYHHMQAVHGSIDDQGGIFFGIL